MAALEDVIKQGEARKKSHADLCTALRAKLGAAKVELNDFPECEKIESHGDAPPEGEDAKAKESGADNPASKVPGAAPADDVAADVGDEGEDYDPHTKTVESDA